MYIASISGNLTQVTFCLQNGADLNFKDSNNLQKPLIYGILYSYIHELKINFYLKTFSLKNLVTIFSILTFLIFLASVKGYLKILNALIQANASLNTQDNIGYTALHYGFIKIY